MGNIGSNSTQRRKSGQVLSYCPTNCLSILVLILILCNIYTIYLLTTKSPSSLSQPPPFQDNYISNEHLEQQKSFFEPHLELDNNINNECDWTIEKLFNNSIEVLKYLKKKNYMNVMECPDNAKIGWRPNKYVPFIFGSQCEPWWARDAIFIMSRILNKNMYAVEYGSGASSIWLAMHVGKIIAMEGEKTWRDSIVNITNYLGIQHLEVKHFNPGKRYVEVFDYNNDGIPLSSEEKKIIDKEWKYNLDFVSVDGRVRRPCIEYIINYIKPHGGILLLDNSDREGDNGLNATTSVPNHWLRYDSSYLDQHIQNLTTLRWLENSRTTLYITRDLKCLQKKKTKD